MIRMPRPSRLTPIYGALALLNLAVAAVLAWQRLFDLPMREYAHRLVSYHDGFIRRGLVGDIYSRFLDVVPVGAVNVEGLLAVGVALALGALLFARIVRGGMAERLQLACFVFGSPLLFKNFIGNNTKFDVFGAIVLLIAALLPLRVATYGLVGALSTALLLVHHINATLFVPAIYGVLALRMTSAGFGVSRVVAVVAPSLALLGLLFLSILMFGTPAMPPEAFQARMLARSAVPLPAEMVQMWYSTLAEEIALTWQIVPGQLIRLPVYAALIVIHWPVIAFARQRLRPAEGPALGELVFRLALLAVAAGYAITCVIAFDYARFLGTFAFCLTVLVAVRIEGATGPIEDASALRGGDWRVIACATVIAALPWVGTVFPLI